MKIPQKTIFDHLNAIYTNKSIEYFNSLTDGDLKTYNQYMLNRFISMNPVGAVLVSELQQYGTLPNKAHYIFFSSAFPTEKRFDKYIKSTNKKIYVEWVVELVSKYYEISNKEATEYLDIYYSQNREALKGLCELYGKNEKEIKELKL